MGARKSQLAIEICYRFKEKNWDTWVFWVHGSNLARFRQDFEEIALVVKIPGYQTAGVDFLSLVSRWLRDTPTRWFMVLDNADDHSLFFATPDNMVKPLSSYIPETPNGCLLVTTVLLV